ncbi:MAG: dihydroxy-acid dehydratase [Alphaproteobacteria bacterium]|nr:MAG: dihydroxy-acid dehydratase [Alphaproteobacteria bacterium]
MGISNADFDKPKIAIVNSSNQLSVCFQHLDQVSVIVQEAVRSAGGLPFEVRTVAPSDFITSAGKQGRYLMPSRDLLVNDVEVQVEGALLDGMILLASCDKTTPAQLMAAVRLNIPSIVVPCGYQMGSDQTDKADIGTVYESVGSLKAGLINIEQLTDLTDRAIRGPGVCAGLATANSMHILSEALGMSLSGSAPIRAASKRQLDMASKAGSAILSLIKNDVRPRLIVTSASIRNALTVAAGLGVSVNCVRHLTAIAIEGECDIDVIAELEALTQIPQIAAISPNGKHRIEDLDAAGGCRGVMRRLAKYLDMDVLTVNERTLGELLGESPEPDNQVIRELENPISDVAGLVVLRGNLAPDGAIVKRSAVPKGIKFFKGPSKIFEDEDKAILALESGEIHEGDVIVLRMMGPLGGPGTVFAASFMAALVGAGLGRRVAVVTDGELSGLNSGITLGQIMPEAAEGGPLAVVQEGDVIEIDLQKMRVNLDLDGDEIKRRLKAWRAPDTEQKRGWLTFYKSLVSPLSKGAVLMEKTRD